MAYRDSDYTIVIATMQLPKRTILVLKLTLVVEIQTLLSCRRPPLLDRSLRSSLPVQLLRRSHKDSDHTVVIAVAHMPKHRAGEVVSAVISSCLPFGRHCSRSTERGATWHVC